MPYTPAQRRLFHAMSEDPDVAREHGTSQQGARKLAEEADKLKREGREKRAKAAATPNRPGYTQQVHQAQQQPRHAAERDGFANHAPGHSMRTGTIRGQRGLLSG